MSDTLTSTRLELALYRIYDRMKDKGINERTVALALRGVADELTTLRVEEENALRR